MCSLHIVTVCVLHCVFVCVCIYHIWFNNAATINDLCKMTACMLLFIREDTTQEEYLLRCRLVMMMVQCIMA